MKKSLIALAALAAVSAASAQSSVTLYGVVDIGYGSHTTKSRDGSVSIKSSGIMDGANAGNRIGFRGTEDLGGGLKANFVVEQGISPTTGQLFGVRAGGTGHQVDGFGLTNGFTGLSGAGGSYSTSTNRQSYVGLSSDKMGTVNVGWQYNIYYEISTLAGYNIGSEGVPGADKAHILGINAGLGGARSNGISYISPAFAGGFTVRAQYGANTGRETVEANGVAVGNGLTTDKNRRMALMLQYANGPLSVAGAYTTIRSTQVNGVALAAAGQTTNVLGFLNAAPTGTPLTGVGRTANVYQLGSSYDFGVAKLAATYLNGKNGGTATSLASTKFRAYQLGVSAPFGAIVPFITFGRGKSTNETTNLLSEDYKSAQIGVRYSLSKRTTAYAFYGRTTNEAAAATALYRDSKAIVGVAHSF